MASGMKCATWDKEVAENDNPVGCDRCHIWHHEDCAGTDAGEFNILKQKVQPNMVMYKMQTKTAEKLRYGSNKTEYRGNKIRPLLEARAKKLKP
jgi:hypothetical protein